MLFAKLLNFGLEIDDAAEVAFGLDVIYVVEMND
jgi:hypothetical protein